MMKQNIIITLILMFMTGCVEQSAVKKTVDQNSLLCKVNSITLASGQEINTDSKFDTFGPRATLNKNGLVISSPTSKGVVVADKIIKTGTKDDGYYKVVSTFMTGYDKALGREGYRIHLYQTLTRTKTRDFKATIISVTNPIDGSTTHYQCIVN